MLDDHKRLLSFTTMFSTESISLTCWNHAVLQAARKSRGAAAAPAPTVPASPQLRTRLRKRSMLPGTAADLSRAAAVPQFLSAPRPGRGRRHAAEEPSE